jgi:hypothetical protein
MKNINLIFILILIIICLYLIFYISREKFESNNILKYNNGTFIINDIGVLKDTNQYKIQTNLSDKNNKFYKFSNKEENIIYFDNLDTDKLSVYFLFEFEENYNNMNLLSLVSNENTYNIFINNKMLYFNDLNTPILDNLLKENKIHYFGMTFTNTFIENTRLDIFNYINMLNPKEEQYGKINIYIDENDVFTYGPNVSSTEKLDIITLGGANNISINNGNVTNKLVSFYSGFIGRIHIHKNILIDNYSMCKKINCDMLFERNEKNKYYELSFMNQNNFTINTKIETIVQPTLLDTDSKIDKETKINNYFNSLITTSIKYDLPKQIKLQYYSNNYYSNINNNYSKYICFLININDKNYKNISNLKFLNTEVIIQQLQRYQDLWLLKIGIRTPKESFIKYCKHNVYFTIFKKDNKYHYTELEYDIESLYNLQNNLTILKHVDKKTINNNLRIKLNNFFEDQYNINYNNMIITPLVNYNIIFVHYINHTRILQKSFLAEKIIIIGAQLSTDENKSLNTCMFEPLGSTQEECIQLCNNDTKNGCNNDICNQKCNNCKTLKCKWNNYDFLKNDLLTPSSTKIRGFSGNNMVKLTWLKPISDSDIINYYIIKVTNCPSILDSSKCPKDICLWENDKCIYNNNNIEVIKYINNGDILEYYIKNIFNNISYTFYIISKNEYGISKLSNKITLIPNSNSKMTIDTLISIPYDNSLEDLYSYHNSKNIESETTDIKQIINTSLKNDLKDILIDKSIKENTLTGNYAINIF